MVKRSHNSSNATSEDEGSSIVEESASPPPRKLSAADMDATASPKSAIQCSLPPHRETLKFPSIEDFEVHYAKDHSNRCTSCGKNFPTAHFLALHIDEHHNTFREAMQAKGEKTYACFVEGCERRCSTPQKRRLHLIDKHSFPKMYHFRIVDTGIDQSTSMLHEGRRRRVSTAMDHAQANRHRRQESRTEPGTDAQDSSTSVVRRSDGADSSKRDRERNGVGNLKSAAPVSDPTVNDLAASMSALRFVPHSVANKQRNKQSLK
ncbi:hypothetical protein A1O1_08553 [Capronia coronata CBS 617.96]|uniref:C2H2-type domain-containing protein n=1 Tax=Capronia coronata CBS 617.96 TaxID=1182541 RepID=W9XJQ6_9EURO|nr:uncharacterized protein A1O1_08553 [Capronia coronata CBS 617.96]EXJ80408.1 hypothetical protein A1O1_08553 [Capronia coronata CBS 617.96]